MSKQETRLRISDSLSLPLDFVTSTCAIVAQKGKGKSHTAKALAEELLDAGQQVGEVLMRKCPHEHQDWEPDLGERYTPIAWYCLVCRRYLSQGKSNDTAAVKVEVRAAEIARSVIDGKAKIVLSFLEIFGWQWHRDAENDDDSLTPETPSILAGWLAREIYTHASIVDAKFQDSFKEKR